jgi:hypothetical protein
MDGSCCGFVRITRSNQLTAFQNGCFHNYCTATYHSSYFEEMVPKDGFALLDAINSLHYHIAL